MRQKPTERDKPLHPDYIRALCGRWLALVGCQPPCWGAAPVDPGTIITPHALPLPTHTHDHCCLHSTRLLHQLHASLPNTPHAHPCPSTHRHSLTRHHLPLQQPVKHKVPPWPMKIAPAPTSWFMSACCGVLWCDPNPQPNPNTEQCRQNQTCSSETHMCNTTSPCTLQAHVPPRLATNAKLWWRSQARAHTTASSRSMACPVLSNPVLSHV